MTCASPPSHQIYIVAAWKKARGVWGGKRPAPPPPPPIFYLCLKKKGKGGGGGGGGGVTSVLPTWTTSYLLGESEALSNKPDLHKTVSIKDNEEISCHRAKAILL